MLAEVQAEVAGRPADTAFVLLLDFDGTLAEFNPDPAAPELTPERYELLKTISAMPGVAVGIVSGRRLDDLRVVVQRPSLEVYPVAAPVRGAHELLVSPRFPQLIRELEARHALVLIDTPASLVASDTAMILEHVPACLLLARFGLTRMRNLRQLVASLPRQKILGELLNGVRVSRHRYYDYYGPESSAADSGQEPGAP